MEHVEDLTGREGARFFTKHWTPAPTTPVRAAVLFVHGQVHTHTHVLWSPCTRTDTAPARATRFIERVERYDHVFPKYAENGIAVFGFDQRGKSLSTLGAFLSFTELT